MADPKPITEAPSDLTTQCFIGKLPREATEDQLKEYFIFQFTHFLFLVKKNYDHDKI